MKVGISAVIITFNEERNIQRCLESLNGVADEIIIVDSYSTDRTEEICRTYNDTVYQAQVHSVILNRRTGPSCRPVSPYILSLDADEALSEELRASILMVKRTGPMMDTISTG